MSESTSRLEPFLLLAKSAKGAAAAKIIEDATAANGVYVFGELANLPSIQELRNDPSFAKHIALLELFSYGTLATYQANTESYPPLTATQLNKLKHLTLVSMALQNRSLPYSDLISALQIPDERQLEDLIIDVIYAGLLTGRMYHHEKILQVDWVSGRDLSLSDIETVQKSLQNWCSNAQTLLAALDEQINHVRRTAQVESAQQEQYITERDQRFYTLSKEARENKDINGKLRGLGGGGGGGLRTRGAMQGVYGHGVGGGGEEDVDELLEDEDMRPMPGGSGMEGYGRGMRDRSKARGGLGRMPQSRPAEQQSVELEQEALRSPKRPR